MPIQNKPLTDKTFHEAIDLILSSPDAPAYEAGTIRWGDITEPLEESSRLIKRAQLISRLDFEAGRREVATVILGLVAHLRRIAEVSGYVAAESAAPAVPSVPKDQVESDLDYLRGLAESLGPDGEELVDAINLTAESHGIPVPLDPEPEDEVEEAVEYIVERPGGVEFVPIPDLDGVDLYRNGQYLGRATKAPAGA